MHVRRWKRLYEDFPYQRLIHADQNHERFTTMYEKFCEVKEKLGDFVAYIFVKAATKSLSTYDVTAARKYAESVENPPTIVNLVAGHNIDDPDKTIFGIRMLYNRPDLISDEVIRFLAVDMGWGVEATLKEFDFEEYQY